MGIKLRDVRHYVTRDGHEPFFEWLDTLKDNKTKSIIIERLNRVRLGNLGDCKHLGGRLYELRIRFGAGYRVYFGDEDGIIVILLCGGTKRTQKRDIQKAKNYWQEF